ncbi:MAG: hypothetical protein J6X60_07455 [Ruminiclostridium sp.]|nr:hypothetical protein [Ruminiclostridium sp.]
MSENDNERKTGRLEKENKKLKKRGKAKGKVILFLLLIIVILAALLFFFDPFGFGIGPNAKGSGGAGSQGAVQGAAETIPGATAAATTSAVTEPAALLYNVTVSGGTYTVDSDGSETTVEAIVDFVYSADAEYIVNIHDNNATKNAMDALTAALDEKGLKYTIVEG